MRQTDLSLERSRNVYLKAEWFWRLVILLLQIHSIVVSQKDSGIIKPIVVVPRLSTGSS